MRSLRVLLILIISRLMESAVGYKILTVCPIPAPSHNNLCRGIVDALVERGHEITFITGIPAKEPKYKEIYIKSLTDFKLRQPSYFDFSKMSQSEMVSYLSEFNTEVARLAFEDEGVKKMMSDKAEKFDLVIYEHYFNKIFIGLGVKYRSPVIALTPITPMVDLSDMTNNPQATATLPNAYTSYTSEMNFMDRFINTAVTLSQTLLMRFKIEPPQKADYEKYLPEESQMVPFDELDDRLSLVFSNSHPSFTHVRPLYPNTIEVAGYHISEPEPLSDDLKKILDDAEDGAVYFSMGSNLKSSEMTPEMKHAFLEAFKSLKQTILWKYEGDLPGKSDNVIIRKWMPQTGILAHPNVKLFISHGGMLSCTEAVHYGIPLLSLPIFCDQRHNAHMVERKGYGITLELKNITDVSLNWALKELLEKRRYFEKAREVHRLYHDRPMRPRDSLVYYSEYVIRTKGGKHLTPPPLPKYSRLLLDIIMLLVTILGFGLALATFLMFKYVPWFKKRDMKNVKGGKKHKNQ